MLCADISMIEFAENLLGLFSARTGLRFGRASVLSSLDIGVSEAAKVTFGNRNSLAFCDISSILRPGIVTIIATQLKYLLLSPSSLKRNLLLDSNHS